MISPPPVRGFPKTSPRRIFRSRFGLVLFFVLTWLGIALLLAFLLFEGRREVERNAGNDALAASSFLEARLAAVIRRLHGELEHLASSTPEAAFRRESAPIYREAVLAEMDLCIRHFPEVAGFQMLDRHGVPLYARGKAEVLPVAGDSASLVGAGFHIIAGPGPDGGGQRVWAVFDVRNSQGVLQGSIVAPLDGDYLARMLDAIGLGQYGIAHLRRVDGGQPVFSWPAAQPDTTAGSPAVRQRLAAGERRGVVRVRSETDGVERIHGFQRVGDYSLYVVTGLATADYLADWQRTVVIAGVSTLVLFLALSLVLLRLLRAEREEEASANLLRESEARYRMLADNTHDVIWMLDIATRCYTYVSPAVTQMCGYLPEELVGQPLGATLTPDSAERVAGDIDRHLRRIAAGDKAASVAVSELEQLCKDGGTVTTEMVSSFLLDDDGVPNTILGITRNVSERKAAEAELRESNRQLYARIEEIGRLQVALQELAVRDGLTGLYNRRYLDETLEREVSRARREGAPLSLIMLDIDHFKAVNDTYGHQVGDEALRTLAAALLADIRAEDVACRYGGEEFLILCPNMPLETAMQRALAWRAAIEELVVTCGFVRLGFTVSLGLAAYPEHGETPDELTRCADMALYRAKAAGRNQVCVYDGR